MTVSVLDSTLPRYEARIFTQLVADTTLVTTSNVAVLAPAEILTLSGTLAIDGSELTKATAIRYIGAGPESAIVHCEVTPPTTVLGCNHTPSIALPTNMKRESQSAAAIAAAAPTFAHQPRFTTVNVNSAVKSARFRRYHNDRPMTPRLNTRPDG
jgi:hypothetical protein